MRCHLLKVGTEPAEKRNLPGQGIRRSRLPVDRLEVVCQQDIALDAQRGEMAGESCLVPPSEMR
jgi:hypothetical protein